MTAKPRIAIVGPGNLGTALAFSLRRAGYEIEAIIAREKSLRKAQAVAKKVGARVDSACRKAELVWFCVPDGEIARASRVLADEMSWKGMVAFHSSGALTSNELKTLRRRGATVASVHPLMTFVRGSRPSLAGVPFAVEGDPGAVRVAHRIVRHLEGQAYPIRKQDKAAYHAWCTFVSPLFTALLATSQQVAGMAGIEPKQATRRIVPILLQTLTNYADFGPMGAFSGPIIRGDIDTVRQHLRVLRQDPVARGVYAALARAAIAYLATKNKKELRQIVRG